MQLESEIRSHPASPNTKQKPTQTQAGYPTDAEIFSRLKKFDSLTGSSLG